VLLKIITYPRIHDKLWCSKGWSEKETINPKKIFDDSKALNPIISYVLKRINIIENDVDVEGMKVI